MLNQRIKSILVGIDMNTQTILDDIKAQLEKAFPDIAIELYPEDPDTYRLNHPHGAILIGYQGSIFSESEDITFVNQSRDLAVHYTIFSRSKWGDQGAIQYLDRLRRALTGFLPANCKKGTLHREQFISGGKGLWCYLLIENFNTYNIQSLDVKVI